MFLSFWYGLGFCLFLSPHFLNIQAAAAAKTILNLAAILYFCSLDAEFVIVFLTAQAWFAAAVSWTAFDKHQEIPASTESSWWLINRCFLQEGHSNRAVPRLIALLVLLPLGKRENETGSTFFGHQRDWNASTMWSERAPICLKADTLVLSQHNYTPSEPPLHSKALV